MIYSLIDLHVQSMEKSTTFAFVCFSVQNKVDQKKSYVFKPVKFLFHHDSLIPVMPCLAWKRSRCHSNKTSVSLNLHLHSSFLSHAEHTQPVGPDSRSTASVNSKEAGRLFHEIAQTTANLASRNNDEQSQPLFIIYYSQARDQ